MPSYVYLFEAKSIQEYILRSSRLRHIVGASELLDSLTGRVLDDVLAALNLTEAETIRFSRRAGGAVYLFTDRAEYRDRFRELWSLVVQQYAPGLRFVMAEADGEHDYAAYIQAKEDLQAANNFQAAALPAGTPVTRYAPRTGLPAIAREPNLGLQDEATHRFGHRDFWQRGDLTGRFAENSSYRDWPRDLEQDPAQESVIKFPFLADNRYLGLVHADGNGLGQLLMVLSDYARHNPTVFTALFYDFSRAIERATIAAAQTATQNVLEPVRKEGGVYPARPIVLGGDDLTILVRADLALPFTQEFLQAFEQCSKEKLDKLRQDYPQVKDLPEQLTGGAGIAFVKSNHPFYMAHALSEELANYAKTRAKATDSARAGKRIPPTVAFHRVTAASHGDYQAIRQQEMTFGRSDQRVITTLGAYGIDVQPPGDLPALQDLQALAGLFSEASMARGPTRQILTLVGQDLDEAGRRYRRWREVMEERDKQANTRMLQQLDEGMTKLCGPLAEHLPVADNTAGSWVTPLGDLAALLAIGKGGDTEQASAQKSTTQEANA